MIGLSDCVYFNKKTQTLVAGFLGASQFANGNGNKYQNPGYMKENFIICIESLHVGDTGTQHNVSWLEVVYVLTVFSVIDFSFCTVCLLTCDVSVSFLCVVCMQITLNKFN